MTQRDDLWIPRLIAEVEREVNRTLGGEATVADIVPIVVRLIERDKARRG